MVAEKHFRRLPLRELLTDAEKRTRDLAEHLHTTWLGHVSDLRELARPVRRRSNYPTLLALLNALRKVLQTSQETDGLLADLRHELEEIRDHARRERLNRS